MKRFYLLCSLVALLCTGVRAQINVTVSVDMAGIMVDPSGVHLVGGFNGWDPTATMMTETTPGSGVYEAVVNRPADDNIEYKVLNGNFYARGPNDAGEEPTSPCAYEYNGNRVFTVPMADASLPTFLFGGCPPGVTRIPLTFRIDAAGQDVGQGVYVVGEMTGFNNDGFTLMNQVGSTTVYETTIMIPADLLKVNFKYSIGANFGGAEASTPAPCANPANSDRFYRFTGGTEETEVYFFNTCDISSALPISLTSFKEDAWPATGTNYYRLTTVDLDGTQYVEGVRTTFFRGSNTASPILLYPNPVTDQLNLDFEGAANISITDALGRPLYQATAADNFTWFATRLTAGRYYLRVETETAVSQIPFVKR